MARKRTTTELVLELDKDEASRALDASVAAGSMRAFYKIVRMTRPSRSYFVRHRGQLHSLKAVATYALQQKSPAFTSRSFHAADAAKRFRELHLDVVHNRDSEDRRRERLWLSRLARPGQAAFRAKLIDLYGQCALSGCTTLAVLEAAHVRPVAGGGGDKAANGILLRADLHKLFDGNLIAIDPASGKVRLSDGLGKDYRALLARAAFIPRSGGARLKDFAERWADFVAGRQ